MSAPAEPVEPVELPATWLSTIRRAAGELERRARPASGGTWRHDGRTGVRRPDGALVAECRTTYDAAHVVGVQPAFGRDLADLLHGVAEREDTWCASPAGHPGPPEPGDEAHLAYRIAVAYLTGLDQ